MEFDGFSSNDEEFQKLINEILAPIDLENFPLENSEFIFGSGLGIELDTSGFSEFQEFSEFTFDPSLNPDPDLVLGEAHEQTKPVVQLQLSTDTQNSLKITQLESRVRELEGQISVLDKYFAELIPWTMEMNKRVNKMSEIISG